VTAQDVPFPTRAPRAGLVIVNTGNGKGKTTAALGLAMRAWGRDLRVCVIQFIKGAGRTGEALAARRMGLEWHVTGSGFTWTGDKAEQARLAAAAWEEARAKILAGNYDIVVLDEFTYAFDFGWLSVTGVIEWLRANKPASLHLVITGRGAPPELIDYADLVTEMVEVKHPFKKGVFGQPGIEY
jgi:cob(I)alamin adenosyltransferase